MLTSNKIAKHRLTFDSRRSRIRKLGELDNIYCGEVIGVADKGIHLAFIIREGEIILSDLLDKRSTQYDFVYDLKNGSYRGKGTVNHYRECERFVAYVLLLLQNIE